MIRIKPMSDEEMVTRLKQGWAPVTKKVTKTVTPPVTPQPCCPVCGQKLKTWASAAAKQRAYRERKKASAWVEELYAYQASK